MHSHPFDDAIRLDAVGDHVYTGQTTTPYANMVGPYGGTTCAVLLNAALLHPERQGDPISLTVNFASPIAGGGFEIEARPVRTNRSTQHWSMQMRQADGVVATATAVLALRRETWSAAEAVAPADVQPAASLARADTRGRPAWTQRYDMRFADGDLPPVFDSVEQPHSRSRLWMRDDPPRPLDFASLAALCDGFFPRIFLRRRMLTPIGTVSLTSYFHADAAALAAQADRHVLGTARAQAYRNGYFDQSAEVWSDDGRLLASTHQIVYYRA
ncbi:MAG: thioesterase family protein [Proteobacteria bacterium]|nr:thioesterase family protein [Pseudomonadota bacterium]